MPIYEYSCKSCGHAFEELVRGDEQPACPACGHGKVERQMSVPAAHVASSGPSACPAKNVCGTSGCCGQNCGMAQWNG
jgi:putative FmdB family regulatory protein